MLTIEQLNTKLLKDVSDCLKANFAKGQELMAKIVTEHINTMKMHNIPLSEENLVKLGQAVEQAFINFNMTLDNGVDPIEFIKNLQSKKK